jgi:cytoskeletal protein RodZ
MTKTKGRNRETILLVVVAVFGVAGLIALQMAQKGSSGRENKALVQSESQQISTDSQTSEKYQKITGKLLATDKLPEAGQPFKFFLTESTNGPVYELDLGDGKPRRPFVNGEVNCIFPEQKSFPVTLYATYEGQEIVLQRIDQLVLAHKRKVNPVGNVVDY